MTKKMFSYAYKLKKTVGWIKKQWIQSQVDEKADIQDNKQTCFRQQQHKVPINDTAMKARTNYCSYDQLLIIIFNVLKKLFSQRPLGTTCQTWSYSRSFI